MNVSKWGFCGGAVVTSRESFKDPLPQPPGRAVPNMVLLLEHKPVYTVGLRSSVYSTAEEARLRALGADFARTRRGGLITFHGPGQLVAYPILDLRSLPPPHGVRCYVSRIEKSVIRFLAKPSYSLCAETSPHTGVWVRDRKICAIGISVQRNITGHGLALNVERSVLPWFEQIVPCGIEGKTVTSISTETGTDVCLRDIVPEFAAIFADTFGYVAELQDFD